VLTVQKGHCNSPSVRSPLKSFAKAVANKLYSISLPPHYTLTQGNTKHRTLSVISAGFILTVVHIYCRQMAYKRRAEVSQNHIRCTYRRHVRTGGSTASEGINKKYSI